MKFAPLPTDRADGAILAHSLTVDGARLKKGTRLGPEELAVLREAGVAEVTVAWLEPGDVAEDEAAARVAGAIAGANVNAAKAFTGRANLFATGEGIALIDADRIDRINALDESLTVATVPPYARMAAEAMLATVKIITFAAPEAAVAEAERIAGEGGPVLSVAPFSSYRAGLVLTVLAGMKETMLQKSREAVAARLQACGSELADSVTVAHDSAEVAGAIARLAAKDLSPILVFGASAIVDRADVIPAGLVQAGGEVRHLGMPVDPGNLMMLGRFGETPVLGVPSCARSPKLNGFDWVLERTLAGLTVSAGDIQAMGPGGLLKEIPSRPQPRRGGGKRPAAGRARIAAVVLAAGRSTRMRGTNKLVAPMGGEPMIRRVVKNILASRAGPVIVVTGYEADRVRAALEGLDVGFVDNPDYEAGLSASLAAGLGAVPAEADGAIICLGDMPGLAPAHIDALIAAFDPEEGREICVPVIAGKRGNPVLWGRAFFAEMRRIAGDVGARHLIGEHAERVAEVAIDDDALLQDVDTPAEAEAARARLAR